MLQAFQHINVCSVDLGVRLEVKGSRIELVLTGVCWTHGADRREVKPLASQSVKCSTTGLRSLEAATIHLLYLLDGQLARNEFGAIGSNEGNAPAH